LVASTLAEKRTRGPNKAVPWSRNPEDGVSVLRLALDTTDPVMRGRIESMFSAGYRVRRAVQSDARHRARAYWAAHHERTRDPAAVRTRLGLSREALERAAYGHLDGAPHLRRFVTKALAMHLADNVWTATERHLFKDASGATLGMPHVGRWYDFTRLPGRARSHTKERKWETFRIHGTLAGHRAAYTGADGRWFQPHRMRTVDDPADSWWRHEGPLVVVFSGLADGPLVLPVRLPAAPSNQPILDHHLADPARWHKIDLVRRRDPNAAGGWRYEAHLMVLAAPYVAPTATARREAAAIETSGRSAGIDVNVSNLTVASHADGRDLRIRRIELGAAAKLGAKRRAIQDRRRQRHLERSRRAANRDQYQWSKRQEKRSRRRELAGLPPVQATPAGARKARSDGKPLQAYRKDQLSASYRRGRATAAAAAAAASQARRDHAGQVAAALAREHGFRLVVEDCNVGAWGRRWGASLAAFSPATLLSAIEREAAAVAQLAGVAGGVLRASTRTTALSQHCLCGRRVPKALADRVHACPACGLRGDRDAVSATLGAFVVFTDPTQPSSARVDVDASRASLDDRRTWTILDDTLDSRSRGRQDAPSESNALSSHGGFSAAERGRTPDAIVVARRTVGMAPRPTPHEPGFRQTTTERTRMRTNLTNKAGPESLSLRDSS
jgi:hypothetical protein